MPDPVEQALPIELPHGRSPGETPGPEGRDMLAAIGRMRHDTLPWLKEQSDTYGPVVRFPIPRLDVLLVNDPDGVQHVLQANHRNYGKRTIQYDTLSLLTGRGLLTNDGDSWMRQRRLAQTAFHARQLEHVGGHVAAAVARLRQSWDGLPDGAEVDVDAAMMRATLEVVGRSLFTTDFAGDADRIVPAVLAALDMVVQRASSLVRLPLAVPTPSNLRMRHAVATLDAAVQPLIQARRARPGDAGHGDDLLGAYLSAGSPEEDLAPLTDREIRDEVVTLIVAGHETVASSLTWTWHLLGQHPEVAQRLRAEADAVLDRGRPPGAADLRALPYTRQVVEESLRLYPPAWLISRRALGDDVIAGHRIRAGGLVILSPWVTQHDARWWHDPEQFDPERWSPERRGEAPRFAYFPFGAGPRLCIGRDFALMESVLLLASLAPLYELAPVPGHQVQAEALVTMRPRDGLPMRLSSRPGADHP